MIKQPFIFTQLSCMCNRQFIIRLIYHWITTLVILTLAAWLPFLLLDITSLSKNTWRSGDTTPGIVAIMGIPPVLIASIIIAFLHTREDRKRNDQSTYWFIWLIPTAILFCTNYACYQYYINYTTQRDQILRQKLEQSVKDNNHPNYTMLADMYKNGWGGPQDIGKANQLYEKACDKTTTPINSVTIQACREIRNYTKLRLLLKDSDDPYDMVTLATLYETGLGGPQNIKKAKELYQKACPDKNDFICTEYKPFQ